MVTISALMASLISSHHIDSRPVSLNINNNNKQVALACVAQLVKASSVHQKVAGSILPINVSLSLPPTLKFKKIIIIIKKLSENLKSQI